VAKRSYCATPNALYTEFPSFKGLYIDSYPPDQITKANPERYRQMLEAVKASGEYPSTDIPVEVLNAPSSTLTTLDNGVRVVSTPTVGDEATISILVEAGSRYESKRGSGVAHLVQKLAFANVKNAVADIGGNVSCDVGREITTYSATVHKSDVAKAVTLLTGAVTATYDQATIDAAKESVIAKLAYVEDNIEDYVIDRLHETAFQQVALGNPVLGTAEGVSSATVDDVSKYINACFTGPRITVAAAGDIEHNALVELAGKTLKSCSNETGATTDETCFTGSDIRFREDGIPLAHTAVALETMGASDAHTVPFMVMKSILGSWNDTSSVGDLQNSEMCSNIASLELARSANAFHYTYKDNGLFGVISHAPQKGLGDLHYLIMDNMTMMCHDVSEHRLRRAKVDAKMQLLNSLDGTAKKVANMGKNVIYNGRDIHLSEMFARIDKVSVSNINATALEFIDDNDHAMAAAGPIHGLPDYNWIRRRTIWLRY
jgi:processing peptidase subunit beta